VRFAATGIGDGRGDVRCDDITDLETRGFVVIRDFLSADDIRTLHDDLPNAQAEANEHHPLLRAGPAATAHVTRKAQDVLALVNEHTALAVDQAVSANWFETGVATGIDFPWHQDHESWFTIQNHYDYLNFYMPIVKPDASRSNLSIIPFDTLQRAAPKAHRHLVGAGATHFGTVRGRWLMFDDATGAVHRIEGNLDDYAHTPQLNAGDLLLLRGDVIHRTQDADTHRLALSLRMTSTATVLKRSRLVGGGLKKAVLMAKFVPPYQSLLALFDLAGKDEVTIGELAEIGSTLPEMEWAGRREFLKRLVAEKRRSRVLIPFALDTPRAVTVWALSKAQDRARRLAIRRAA